jgi:cystathionine beta-lyase/cystathionine gamma-synthase
VAKPQPTVPPLPPPLGKSTPLVPPLYQSSVYTLPDLDALDQIMTAAEPGFIYARDGHPNARQLADWLAFLEGATWGLVCGSGMSAITATLLALVQQDQRIVASNRLYGRTTQLLTQEFERYGIETTLVDTSDLDKVRAALGKGARVLFVETLSNPLLRLVDVRALAEMARERDCHLVVDNTFATPVLARPLALGADVVTESLTKMIGGHSDITLGFTCGRGELLTPVTQVVSIWGFAANPFDAWLAVRGLPTLALRVKAASDNAAALADWLPSQPGVLQVVYPGRPEHPDHELAGKVLQGGYGNMLCFELEGGREAVNHFLRLATGIPFSPSLGNTTTTCSHPASTSHRYVSPAERRRQGISDGLIRLSVGVEDLAEIQRELAIGLEIPGARRS